MGYAVVKYHFYIGLGIPFTTGMTLVNKRKELHLLETKMTFGFLYNGYRP